MIKNINFDDFNKEFKDFGRDSQFSFTGKRALFDYLETLEEETGEKIELDIIALCCDYTEYENFVELQKNYTDIKSIDDLHNYTQVIPIEGSDALIIQNF